MEGGILQDRLTCRGSGALVSSLTVNERILVFSNVARGLSYLLQTLETDRTVGSLVETEAAEIIFRKKKRP